MTLNLRTMGDDRRGFSFRPLDTREIEVPEYPDQGILLSLKEFFIRLLEEVQAVHVTDIRSVEAASKLRFTPFDVNFHPYRLGVVLKVSLPIAISKIFLDSDENSSATIISILLLLRVPILAVDFELTAESGWLSYFSVCLHIFEPGLRSCDDN